MPRTPYGQCNLVTGDDSTYRSRTPQITIPSLRARLGIEQAQQLVEDLTRAIAAAKGPTPADSIHVARTLKEVERG